MMTGQTSPETERSAFIAAYPHLSMDEVPDAWGRPIFKHSHVQALWDGWFARACLDDRKPGLAQSSKQDWLRWVEDSRNPNHGRSGGLRVSDSSPDRDGK
jgi:hypothetical protein